MTIRVGKTSPGCEESTRLVVVALGYKGSRDKIERTHPFIRLIACKGSTMSYTLTNDNELCVDSQRKHGEWLVVLQGCAMHPKHILRRSEAS